jgi:integrase
MPALRVSRPVRRPTSRFIQFRERIPADVLPRAAGVTLTIPVGSEKVIKRLSPKAVEVQCSLQTADQAEGRRRHAIVAGYLGNVWAALRRDQPVTLTSHQATALAGELYRAWAEGEARERSLAILHTPQGWVIDAVTHEEDEAAFNDLVERLAATPEEALEALIGPLASRLLLAKGIAAVEPHSRVSLLKALHRALNEAMALRGRNAGGDFSPDLNSQRFPTWPDAQSPQVALRRVSSSALSLPDLLEMWWKEAQARGLKQPTYLNYRRAIRALCAYLKHEDAARVTEHDIVGFKAHRLETVSASSVKTTDLGGLKTIFQFAVDNALLPTNPARGVTIRVGRPERLRPKSLTEEEASALLNQAKSARKRGKESPFTFAGRRWVPWLCAYTGARVGEMAQLRRQDVRPHGEHWVIRVTPEAGTQKSNTARDIVIHSHLIDEGFIDFVQSRAEGHLFLNVGPGGKVRGVLKALTSRLALVAREAMSDPDVQPMHGWRHRFKTIGREAGVDPKVLDAIQGHAAKSASEGYGEVTLSTQAAALARFPRILVTTEVA